MSNIELIIRAKAKDLGDNFQVRRSLPDPQKKMIGPFIFWDHMGPVELSNGREMKVRAHPHIGLATITWLFSGEIMHRDNLGNEQAILPGEVNWMTAGKGIVHSERAYPKDPAEILEGIQLWLALPKESEDVEPSFFHCKESEIPSIEEKGIMMRLVAGKAFGHESPVPVYSNLFYLNGEAKNQSLFQLSLEDNQEGAVYVIEGNVEVEGQSYERFDLVIFKKGTSIDFQANKDSCFMIFGGDVFPEKRTVWWNFVSTSKEKIELAKDRWRNQDHLPVINEDEIIPLPEN